jgi:hypothetical protein
MAFIVHVGIVHAGIVHVGVGPAKCGDARPARNGIANFHNEVGVVGSAARVHAMFTRKRPYGI